MRWLFLGRSADHTL